MGNLTYSTSPPQEDLPNQRSPVDIPELLQLIFSYLSPHILRSSASLVCRQWNNVAQHMLDTRPVTWRDSDSGGSTSLQHENLRRLQWTNALRIGAESVMLPNLSGKNPPKNWHALASALDLLSQEQRLKIQELSIYHRLLYDTQLLPLLKMVSSTLTMLRMKVIHNDTNNNSNRNISTHNSNNVSINITIPLDEILKLCPHLFILDIHGSTPWRYQDTQTTETERILPTRLRLQSLTLENMAVEESTLMNLLESCPDLQELCFMHLVFRPCYTWIQEGFHVPVGGSFWDNVSKRCPRLRRLHVSSHGVSPWIGDVACIRSKMYRFPRVREWSFLAREMSTVIFKAFRTCSYQNMTSLELVGPGYTSGEVFGYKLHKFLCKTPQLVHLKAPSVDFSVRWLDMEGVVAPFGYTYGRYKHLMQSDGARYLCLDSTTHVASIHRKIWACRNLQTLHIQFRFGEDVSVESSRVIFGYLSRVCPQLQDLQIGRRYFRMDFEGGFCLLSRLHDLRRLRLVMDLRESVDTFNAEWMHKIVTPELEKNLMQQLRQGAEGEHGKRIIARRPFRSVKPKRTNHAVLKLDPTLRKAEDDNQEDEEGDAEKSNEDTELDFMIDGVDMRNLGQWEDIVDLFQDRLSQNWHCWPQMEYLEFRSSYLGDSLGAIRDKIRHVRPEIEVV
ncbi:MAG: hypothetical protein J3Q66DRAFT_397675 [Benniella sp.]|nr:MAG: hypothetical protein J3Q66DRAFT_397675 [Benniella sp.]